MSSFAPASKRVRSEETFKWDEGSEYFPGEVIDGLVACNALIGQDHCMHIW